MLLTITYKGIKLDCKCTVTVTRDPLGTGDSPAEIDVDYDWISLQNNSTEDLMPILDNDLDKITDLVIKEYKGEPY